MHYTISNLATELGITVTKLKAPFKRIKTRNLIALSNFDQNEVKNAINYFSSNYELSAKLFAAVKNQFDEYKNLTTLKEIAEDQNLTLKDFKAFIKTIDRNERFRFLEPNIFAPSDNDCVRLTQVSDLVSLYLKEKIHLNKITSAYVPQFDARTGDKTGMRQELIRVNLLEPVKTKTFKQGQIVGFYKAKNEGYLPIVALYNGNITVETEIKLDPKSRRGYVFNKRNHKHQPISWTFSINQLINHGGAKEVGNSDHHINYFVNMLMDTLAQEHIGCEFYASGTYKNPYLIIRTDPFVINLADYMVNDGDTKKIKDEKISVYGKPSAKFLIEMIKETTSEYETYVSEKTKNNFWVQSRAKKVEIAWLEDSPETQDLLDGLKQNAAETGRPIDIILGNMIKEYYDLIYLDRKEEFGDFATFLKFDPKNSGGGVRNLILYTFISKRILFSFFIYKIHDIGYDYVET